MANSRTYKIWTLMKRRCLNEKDPSFHNYGGRGIEVCERWGRPDCRARVDMRRMAERLLLRRWRQARVVPGMHRGIPGGLG